MYKNENIPCLPTASLVDQLASIFTEESDMHDISTRLRTNPLISV